MFFMDFLEILYRAYANSQKSRFFQGLFSYSTICVNWNHPAVLLIPSARLCLDPVFMRMGILNFGLLRFEIGKQHWCDLLPSIAANLYYIIYAY